ncbi:MAG: methyltransferase [Geminicoccaceae bacterium]|nr:methyltransferase [Geminicoccaceae bacterium]
MTDGLTEDGLLGGRLRLVQPAVGYRVAIDPVLLAAAVPAGSGERVRDAGVGTGAARRGLAARLAEVEIVGLEKDRELHRLAVENARSNGFERRIDLMVGNLLRPPPRLTGTNFDHVMTNPPFLEADRATQPAPAKAGAHVESDLTLVDWLLACLRMLRPGGRLTLIHRADRLAEALGALGGRIGGIVVYPLWPRAADRPAKRVLIQGRKGSNAPLRLARGLVLHEADGSYTAAAHAILYRGAPLPLDPPRHD